MDSYNSQLLGKAVELLLNRKYGDFHSFSPEELVTLLQKNQATEEQSIWILSQLEHFNLEEKNQSFKQNLISVCFFVLLLGFLISIFFSGIYFIIQHAPVPEDCPTDKLSIVEQPLAGASAICEAGTARSRSACFADRTPVKEIRKT